MSSSSPRPEDTGDSTPKPNRKKKKKSASQKTRKPPANFEDSLAELETIVHALEGGDLGLSESLARYELGVQCLKQCFDQLARAERRVELLRGVDGEGNADLGDFDDPELDLEQKAASRGRRRSSGSRASDSDVTDRDGGGVDDSTGLF